MTKVIVLALVLLCGSIGGFSKGKSPAGNCKSLPMKTGKIRGNTKVSVYGNSSTVEITSPNDQVFALVSGEVTSSTDAPYCPNSDLNVVIIRSGPFGADSLITYANLKNTLVKVGDRVQKGQLIAHGVKANNQSDNKVGVSMYIFPNDQHGAGGMDADQLISYISKNDL